MNSWAIVEKETNRAVFETFNKDLIGKLSDKYRAVPILEYLCDLNKKIAEERRAERNADGRTAKTA